MTKGYRSSCVSPETPIRDAVKTIDEGSLQIALVTDPEYRLLGTVTDGDVRRGILRSVPLDRPVASIMNPKPIVGSTHQDQEEILSTMQAENIHHLPIVDELGRVIDLKILEDLLRPKPLDNAVVLMAGGLGTRLVPLTNDCPKPMLPVGGRPILETILKNFADHGFHRFYISVNHKSEMITNHFGDGSKWNVSIKYLHEGEQLGTAGALSLIPDPPEEPLIVMNGDVLTKVNFRHLLNFHVQESATATMCIREFEFQVPYGVITVKGRQIFAIEEKPTQRYFVNAGIYILDPKVLGFVSASRKIDMPELFKTVIERNLSTAVFPLREYWVDVGQHRDLLRANGEFAMVFK